MWAVVTAGGCFFGRGLLVWGGGGWHCPADLVVWCGLRAPVWGHGWLGQPRCPQPWERLRSARPCVRPPAPGGRPWPEREVPRGWDLARAPRPCFPRGWNEAQDSRKLRASSSSCRGLEEKASGRASVGPHRGAAWPPTHAAGMGGSGSGAGLGPPGPTVGILKTPTWDAQDPPVGQQPRAGVCAATGAGGGSSGLQLLLPTGAGPAGLPRPSWPLLVPWGIGKGPGGYQPPTGIGVHGGQAGGVGLAQSPAGGMWGGG